MSFLSFWVPLLLGWVFIGYYSGTLRLLAPMIFGEKGEEEGRKVGEEWEQVGTKQAKMRPIPDLSKLPFTRI